MREYLVWNGLDANRTMHVAYAETIEDNIVLSDNGATDEDRVSRSEALKVARSLRVKIWPGAMIAHDHDEERDDIIENLGYNGWRCECGCIMYRPAKQDVASSYPDPEKVRADFNAKFATGV